MIATEEKYDQHLQSLLGYHVSELEKAAGLPTRQQENFDGDLVHIYDWRRSYSSPRIFSTSYHSGYRGNTFVSFCKDYYTISKETELVNHARSEGNACKAY